jgi:putative transcriptional regulator
MLVDFAAGSLAEAPALIVSSHIALCAECRAQVARFEEVGGALLEEIAVEQVTEGAFERVLALVDAVEKAPLPAPAPAPAQSELASVLPFPLRRYVDASARWRRAGLGVEEIALKLGEGPHQASLLRIKGGRAMAKHRHAGLEFTLVLQGAFTDRGAHYGPGDLCLAAEPEHAPLADASQDCICLAVIDGPLVLTGPLGRLLNPWLRYKAQQAARA